MLSCDFACPLWDSPHSFVLFKSAESSLRSTKRVVVTLEIKSHTSVNLIVKCENDEFSITF